MEQEGGTHVPISPDSRAWLGGPSAAKGPACLTPLGPLRDQGGFHGGGQGRGGGATRTQPPPNLTHLFPKPWPWREVGYQ